MSEPIRREKPANWSEAMAECHPCGHTTAQHLYHDSGDVTLASCPLVGDRRNGERRFSQLPGFTVRDSRKRDRRKDWHAMAKELFDLSIVPDQSTPNWVKDTYIVALVKVRAKFAAMEAEGKPQCLCGTNERPFCPLHGEPRYRKGQSNG